MRYAPKFGLVFIHIPKNAGQSVRNALEAAAPLSYAALARDLGVTEAEAAAAVEKGHQHPVLGPIHPAHLPLDVMAAHFPQSLAVLQSARSFALTRDPRERFFSALIQRMKEFGKAGDIRADDPEVRDEARRVCDWLDGRAGFADLEYVHFTRQTDFVTLAGQRALTAVFPVTRLDALQHWLSETAGAQLEIGRDHARRQPKSWARGVVPAARFVARNLMPRPVRRALHPLWTGSRLFDNAAETYGKVDLGPEIEAFVVQYYAEDARLHAEAETAAKREMVGA